MMPGFFPTRIRRVLVVRKTPAVVTLTVLCLAAAPSLAAPPTKPRDIAAAVGQPVSLSVQPATISLHGDRTTQQLVLTGHYSDGSVRDLTPFAEWNVENGSVAAVERDGFLQARSNGTTVVVPRVGGKTARATVVVTGTEAPRPVSFRREVIASLNVGGCNSGACHGTPSGKAGFRLSLRGFDPAADYVQLTRDVYGRRTDTLEPEASLIFQKGLGRVPHEGGQRFPATSVPARTLRTWLAEGLRDDPANLAPLKAIQVLPGPRVLHQPARWQQLAVQANFADGTVRDVTRLTVFSSSDEAVAHVGPTGLVEFFQAGEVAILCRYLEQLYSVRLTYLEPRQGFAWADPAENNYVDHHVFAKLKMLSIPPSDLCSDQEFLRRAMLDLCGVVPTPDEVRAFLASTDPGKRSKLVDMLLERPEYADFWTLKWADVLRSNRKTLQVKGTHVYHRWLHDHLANNTPFDEVVRELLMADGSTFSNPPANYYRAAQDPQNLAETTAQLFFGVRMQCAKCHNHPFERWTQDDYYSMAAFFARVKVRKDPEAPGGQGGADGSEIVYSDRGGEVTQPRTGKVMPPKVFGMAAPEIPAGKDRRQALAELVTSSQNPFFARSVVNRVWYHLLGRGIVDPVDDFRDSNPSANDELLDALGRDFIDHHFDLKHLVRVIMASRTYQLSAQPNEFNKDDAKYFSHAVTKMLTAEQLLDAICFATDMPEKYAGMPAGTHAIQLPDGDPAHPFLKTFGQPARELACECERESDSNLQQALQLINGPTINAKLRDPNNRLGKLLAGKLPEQQVLTELYLATLSRAPQEAEMARLLEHVHKAPAANQRKAWEDVHWALINSKEFLFRH